MKNNQYERQMNKYRNIIVKHLGIIEPNLLKEVTEEVVKAVVQDVYEEQKESMRQALKEMRAK